MLEEGKPRQRGYGKQVVTERVGLWCKWEEGGGTKPWRWVNLRKSTPRNGREERRRKRIKDKIWRLITPQLRFFAFFSQPLLSRILGHPLCCFVLLPHPPFPCLASLRLQPLVHFLSWTHLPGINMVFAEGLPDGPLVKTHHFQRRRHRFNPWSGN